MPTVFLHGALGSSGQLRGLASRLGVADAVVPDLDGHGARPPVPYELSAFVDTCRDALGSGGDVVGYSLGGYVGLATAVRYPGMVRRLVTIATKVEWTPAVAAAAADPLVAPGLAERSPRFVAAVAAAHPGSSAASVLERTADFLRGLGSSPGLELERVTCPVLVVVGADDDFVGADAEAAAARLPHGRLVVLPDTPHPYERMSEEALAEVIGPFLA